MILILTFRWSRCHLGCLLDLELIHTSAWLILCNDYFPWGFLFVPWRYLAKSALTLWNEVWLSRISLHFFCAPDKIQFLQGKAMERREKLSDLEELIVGWALSHTDSIVVCWCGMWRCAFNPDRLTMRCMFWDWNTMQMEISLKLYLLSRLVNQLHLNLQTQEQKSERCWLGCWRSFKAMIDDFFYFCSHLHLVNEQSWAKGQQFLFPAPH